MPSEKHALSFSGNLQNYNSIFTFLDAFIQNINQDLPSKPCELYNS